MANQADGGDAPVLDPSVRQVYLPTQAQDITYFPRAIGAADTGFSSVRHKVDERRSCLIAAEFTDSPANLSWDDADMLDIGIDELDDSGVHGARYADCPSAAASAKNYASFEKDFKQWLRRTQVVRLHHSKRFKLTSAADESEGEFRVRLQQVASEQRDQAVEQLRKRYGSKANTLENRLLRAEQAVEREQEQSSKKKLDTAVSFGTAILGALLGRKRLTSATTSRVGTAIRSASGARKEASDVARARETVGKVRADLEALNAELEKEINNLDTAFDAQIEKLDEILVKPRTTDIHVRLVGLVWMPYQRGDDGRLSPAWNS
jgi:hypothetical protein